MKILVILAVSFVGFSAQAAYPTFTQSEIDTHKQNITLITKTAADCLEETWKTHIDFFEMWNVSKFFGGRRKDYATPAGRLAALEKYNAPSHLLSELESTSCVGLARKCLGKGFAKAGQAETWQKIEKFLAIDNKVYGTDMQVMLQSLGWKLVYWNPDPSMNAKWDQEDQKLNPLKPGKKWNAVWGGHAYNYNQVMKNGKYSSYGMKIDDKKMLVGFGAKQPAEFTEENFFVGVAHAGYHVFPGTRGEVIEAHSMRDLNSEDNMERSPFNPLAPGGGPRWTKTEKYRSGVIALPPKP